MNPGGILLGTLPVLALLLLLFFLDSYKLAPARAVVRSLLVGAAAAWLALLLNTWLLDATGLDTRTLRRYVAPPLEELLKAVFVAWLVRARRTGFVVDAAIHGFAVGAGFALVENIHYLRMLPGSSLSLWAVRGFGTAINHGSTTAIFATLSKLFSDRHPARRWLPFVPGLVAASAIHSLFNHFVLPPVAMTALLLIVMPILFVTVFDASAKATKRWLGTSFDTQMELLDLILSGDVRQSRVGSYLQSLRQHFPPAVLADMLCYLRIYLELSMRAKVLLIAHQAGMSMAVGEEERANLEELRYLEKSIGPVGRLALEPFLPRSSRELWQLYMLRK